eukprot:1157850-Pelagomonas_calceolata.AAC.15
MSVRHSVLPQISAAVYFLVVMGMQAKAGRFQRGADCGIDFQWLSCTGNAAWQVPLFTGTTIPGGQLPPPKEGVLSSHIAQGANLGHLGLVADPMSFQGTRAPPSKIGGTLPNQPRREPYFLAMKSPFLTTCCAETVIFGDLESSHQKNESNPAQGVPKRMIVMYMEVTYTKYWELKIVPGWSCGPYLVGSRPCNSSGILSFHQILVDMILYGTIMVGNNNGWHDKIEENKKKTGKSISSNIEELSTSAVIQDRHHAFQGQLHVMCCEVQWFEPGAASHHPDPH